MAMSCEADQKAIKTATAATAPTFGEEPWIASPRSPTARNAWHTIIQERLRPRKPGVYRSMRGAQSTLNVHGAWASEKRPTVRMSTPRYVSHAGREIHTIPSGSPEEND